MTVTADTNIYVSALLFGGEPARLLTLAQMGIVELAISDPILDEISRTLRSRKFRLSESEAEDVCAVIRALAVHVSPTRSITVVADDPSDNRILECAVASESTYLISGDKHLPRLAHFEGIQIVRLSDFLRLL